MNKTAILFTVIGLVLAGGATAVLVRDSGRASLFGDVGGMGDSRLVDLPGGQKKVWLLAQNDEYVYLNGKIINNWPDSTSIYYVQTGSQTQTNIPLAPAELTGTYRVRGDFTDKEQLRMGVTAAVAGTAASRVYVQYTLNGNNWFNVSRSDLNLTITGAAPITSVTAWEDLPVGMKAGDVTLRVMTLGGDGVADPQYRGVWIETR